MLEEFRLFSSHFFIRNLWLLFGYFVVECFTIFPLLHAADPGEIEFGLVSLFGSNLSQLRRADNPARGLRNVAGRKHHLTNQWQLGFTRLSLLIDRLDRDITEQPLVPLLVELWIAVDLGDLLVYSLLLHCRVFLFGLHGGELRQQREVFNEECFFA